MINATCNFQVGEVYVIKLLLTQCWVRVLMTNANESLIFIYTVGYNLYSSCTYKRTVRTYLLRTVLYCKSVLRVTGYGWPRSTTWRWQYKQLWLYVYCTLLTVQYCSVLCTYVLYYYYLYCCTTIQYSTVGSYTIERRYNSGPV